MLVRTNEDFSSSRSGLTMNESNNTIALSDINVIMPLISILSTHFLVNSFTLSTDMGVESTSAFVKIASEFHLEVNSNKIVEDDTVDDEDYHYNNGYLLIGKPDLNFSKVVNGHPKLIVAVYTMAENDSAVPQFLSEVVIPPPIAFFVIPVTTKLTLKCLRLYKPISDLPAKVYPTMSYGGLDEPKWTWESENTNWHSFTKEVRNMKGVNISIGLVSHLEEKPVVDRFWGGKNSFFWRVMEEHLHYRSTLHFRHISLKIARTAGDVYRKMLQTGVDGLGILPVITPERNDKLRFIPTGIDQKYHLMVRKPQYVHSWNSIFKPLTDESWICLGLAILLISITLRAVTTRENTPIGDLSSCILTIFGFVCSQGCPNMPANPSGRTVCYVTLIFSILIYQFYTSNFYSLLSTKEVSLPFNSIEEFLAKRTHKLYVHPETAIYDYIMTAKSGSLKKIGDVLRADPTHQLTNDKIKKSLRKVCKGAAAILGLPSQTLMYSDLKCKLVPVNSGYFPGNTITPLRKTFPFMSQFKFVHLRLKETGITHRYRDEFFTVHQQTKTDVVNEAVTMIHVAFLLVLHAAAVILSWIILGFEIMTSKTIKIKKKKRAGSYLKLGLT